jgi:indole-3-glycerol phosphate synthase
VSTAAVDEGSVLVRIISDKKIEVKARARRVPVRDLQVRCREMPLARGFIAGMRARVDAGDPAVIAEIKRASPSRGLIREDFSPRQIAGSYQSGGAACLSVLTDETYFLGRDEHLVAAREACSLPVLRKDFTIQEYQVWEARALGADCILLIVAVLEDALLRDLNALAGELGLDVLVEVHNETELQRVAGMSLPLIGINNRDLRNFTTSLDTTIDLLPGVPDGCLVVTESGIHSREDVAKLRAVGVRAFLVGEAFMSSDDPGERLAEMFY